MNIKNKINTCMYVYTYFYKYKYKQAFVVCLRVRITDLKVKNELNYPLSPEKRSQLQPQEILRTVCP